MIAIVKDYSDRNFMTGSVLLLAKAAPHCQKTKTAVIFGYDYSTVQPITPVSIESTSCLQCEFKFLILIAETIQTIVIGIVFFTALIEGHGGVK